MFLSRISGGGESLVGRTRLTPSARRELVGFTHFACVIPYLILVLLRGPVASLAFELRTNAVFSFIARDTPSFGIFLRRHSKIPRISTRWAWSTRGQSFLECKIRVFKGPLSMWTRSALMLTRFGRIFFCFT